MIEFLEHDETLALIDIENFMDEVDEYGVFDSRFDYPENFVSHFLKLLSVGQIVTYRDGKKLRGLCSWAMVDPVGKLAINKRRWLLPDNVVDGDIMYVDVCLLKPGASIFKLETFRKKRYPHLKEVFWFHMTPTTTRQYSLKFKGV